MARSPIWLAVDKINERLDKLEANFATPAIPVVTPIVENPTPVKVSDYPIPPEYKDIIHLTFNKAFDVRLEPMKDTPAFLFSIVVPKKYSKITSGEDIRPKVITYSDGVSGVRMWANKVWDNLGKDLQEVIVQDRPFVQASI